MRVPFETMVREFERVLAEHGFSEQRAHDAALIFADNSLCGVASHGLNRFPIFIKTLEGGDVDPSAEPECIASFGAIERWDGHRGFGPLGAKAAMERAVELSKVHGIGLVALGNNNHWMRGGTYGWIAAEAGCIGICWSNTMPNMPAWGSVENRIGNNPVILSVPRSDGNHFMVDCALSQFSYGKLESVRLAGEELPVYGGYDKDGNLTKDPALIEESRRVLPAGYWKGSGVSILLDMITSVLTCSHTVATVGTFSSETGLSQIMIAIDPRHFNTVPLTDSIISSIAEDVKASRREDPDKSVRIPAEAEQRARRENLRDGIPVSEEKWREVLYL